MRRSMLVILMVCVGCTREAGRTQQWPRLLSERELESYRAAEEALSLTGTSFEELKVLCTLQREDIARELARFSLTVDAFLDIAQLVLFARYGREIFGDLPQKKHALCKELLKRCRDSGDEDLKKRLEQELQITELVESRFVATVLANTQIMRDYERKQARKKHRRAE